MRSENPATVTSAKTVPARLVALLTTATLGVTLLVAAPAPAGARVPAGAVTAQVGDLASRGVVARRDLSRQAGRYNPPSGVLFNDPYGGDEARYRIWRHIVRSINAVPRGEQIRAAAWNLRSPRIADALINAHRRGVSVRVVMDRVNAMAGKPNRDADRVQRALRQGNPKRRPAMRSWLRKCAGSCRSPRGIPHTKFYAFSKVGKKSRDVVIYGSANATDLAATIQWNDVFTIKGRSRVYADWVRVFDEMGRDTWVRPPLRHHRYDRHLALTYYAYAARAARAKGDPTMKILNGIRCQGAGSGTGTNGRTKIRIAQTAMHGPRGKALARRLAQMKRRGCDIKIAYAMFGGEVVKILRGSGIRMTHLAHDSNDDGVYDRYVHMKAMAVSGVYRGDNRARVVWNGSANWTGVALESDEVVGEIRRPWVTRQYMRWIDRLTRSRPPSWNNRSARSPEPLSAEELAEAHEQRTLAIAAERGVDPYALIKSES
jgi:hypothetical protein